MTKRIIRIRKGIGLVKPSESTSACVLVRHNTACGVSYHGSILWITLDPAFHQLKLHQSLPSLAYDMACSAPAPPYNIAVLSMTYQIILSCSLLTLLE